MNPRSFRFLQMVLLAISLASFSKAGLGLYFYNYPQFASEKLYTIYKAEQRREHQRDSFAMALEDFDKQTRNSGGKAVMMVLNIPENQPQKDMSEELQAKNKSLKEMIFGFSSGVFFLIFFLFLKNTKDSAPRRTEKRRTAP